MCKRVLAAVLIVGCVGLSEFLVDDPGSLSQPAYSALTPGPRNISQAQRHANPLIIPSLGFTSISCSVSLVSTFHRQFRLSWLNHVFLI
jgi:hypothetical protein